MKNTSTSLRTAVQSINRLYQPQIDQRQHWLDEDPLLVHVGLTDDQQIALVKLIVGEEDSISNYLNDKFNVQWWNFDCTITGHTEDIAWLLLQL